MSAEKMTRTIRAAFASLTERPELRTVQDFVEKCSDDLQKCQNFNGFAGTRSSIVRQRRVALGRLPGSPAAPATSLESARE